MSLSPVTIALVGLTAIAVAMGIGRFAFTPILPMMQHDAGLSVTDGSWLASANYIGFLLGALSAVVVQIRPVAAILGGLLVISIVTLGMAVESHFAGWLTLRTIAGFANAWAQIFAFAWSLEKLSAVGRPILNGAVFGGVGIGIAVTGLVCLALMQAEASSRQAWTGLGAISLLATAMISPIMRSDDTAAIHKARTPAVGAMRWDADALRLILCFGASGFGYIIPATFLPVMGRQIVSDPLVFGWSWPLFGVATALAPLMTAGWAKRIGNRRLWMLSHLVMAVGVSIPVWWPTIGGIILSALLVGGTFMVNAMASMQEAKVVACLHATALMAAMTASFAAGQIIGPIFVAYIAGNDGRFASALLAAAFLLVISGLALTGRRVST